MYTKKALLIALVASALLLSIGAGPQMTRAVQALSDAQASQTAPLTVPYSGRLNGADEQPIADGAYDFTFALYDAISGGNLLWTETQEDVLVQGGIFTTLLGRANALPTDIVTGGERWLVVAVRGPGEADFTALAPRQQLSAVSPAAPSSTTAGAACPHDHYGEVWSGSVAWSNGAFKVNNTSNGPSVWGVNTGGGNAVRGDGYGASIGVYGEGAAGPGVAGRSASGAGGVFSSGDDHNDLILGGAVGRINTDPADQNSQLYLSSNADVIVKLDNDGGENNALRIKSSAGTDVCTVSEAGNLVCTGSKSAVVETAGHGQRLLYAVESPEVWFEDVGSASLVKGAVTVAFDPTFGETVNLEEEYHVFVTPLCQEPVLLFVTAKTAAGFTVRGVTLDNQAAECGFDYRIVAKRLGYENVRLPSPTLPAVSDGQ